MAVESPPAFLQAGTYGAEQTRRGHYFMLQRGASIGSIVGGLVNATDCQLTPPGSGMTVNVGAGEVLVPGSLSATQSGYYCRVSSSTSLAIATSDPSNPRIDTVCAVVADAAYTGVANSFTVSVVTGTPTPGATLVNLSGAGSVPANSLVLGYVLVPAAASNIIGADVSNVAAAVQTNALGISSGTLASRPTSGKPPRAYYATDTQQYFFDAVGEWVAGLGLNGRAISGSTTANPGECIIVSSGNPLTVTLPAPTPGAMIGVYAFATSGASPVTVSAGAVGIIGVGVNATSLVLGTVGSCVLLLANGTSNWAIVSGTQDTGWISLTLNGSTGGGVVTGTGTQVAAARKIGDFVKLRGYIAMTGPPPVGAGSQWATLPSGLRPAAGPVQFVSSFFPGSAPSIILQVNIATSGVLTIADSVGTTATISLEGMNFTLT